MVSYVGRGPCRELTLLITPVMVATLRSSYCDLCPNIHHDCHLIFAAPGCSVGRTLRSRLIRCHSRWDGEPSIGCSFLSRTSLQVCRDLNQATQDRHLWTVSPYLFVWREFPARHWIFWTVGPASDQAGHRAGLSPVMTSTQHCLEGPLAHNDDALLNARSQPNTKAGLPLFLRTYLFYRHSSKNPAL